MMGWEVPTRLLKNLSILFGANNVVRLGEKLKGHVNALLQCLGPSCCTSEWRGSLSAWWLCNAIIRAGYLQQHAQRCTS